MTPTPRWARRQERRFAPRSNARGTALMEFALVFPLLLVLTLAVVDLSRAFFVKNLLYQAAREGARALVVSAPGDTARMKERIDLVVTSAGMKAGSTRMSSRGGPDGMVIVTVASKFNWVFPDLFRIIGGARWESLELRGVAAMRREGI
jgi:Flp pilus assembly protein TadG